MKPPDLDAARTKQTLAAAVAAQASTVAEGGHQHGGMASVREVSHRGHDIVIRTTYEITVDGEPFDAHLTVADDGRVHYHGLPNRDFESTVDLVTKAIDAFPEDFAGGATEPHDGHDHGGHDHGERDGEHHPGGDEPAAGADRTEY